MSVLYKVNIVDCQQKRKHWVIRMLVVATVSGNKKIWPDFSIVNSFVKQRLMVTFPCHLVAKLGITIIRLRLGRRNIWRKQDSKWNFLQWVWTMFPVSCDVMKDCYKCCKNNFILCLFLRTNKINESNNSSQNKPSSVKFSTKIFLS